jgi:phosphoglycolate phosphatase
MTIIPAPKAVIFDWDNTLVDSHPIMVRSLQSTLQKLGVSPVTKELVNANMHRSLRDYFPEVFGRDWEIAKKYYYEFYHQFSDKISPLPNAERLLILLKKHNIPSLIVSNKGGPRLREEISSLKWDKYFIEAVGATDLQEDKPSKLPVIHVLNKINMKPNENIWFVGDTIADIDCAYNSNCLPILFNNKKLSGFTKAGHKPRFTYITHIDIINTVENLL